MSTMPPAAPRAAPVLRGQGLLRVVTPEQLGQHEQEVAEYQAQLEARPEPQLDDLVAHVRTQFEIMQTHRNSASGWRHRLERAQRVFNGQYDPTVLAEIKTFGGSDIYASVTAVKCRGASALLRDIFISNERSWAIDPTPEPVLPDDVSQAVMQLVEGEAAAAAKMGAQLDETAIRDRMDQLMLAAEEANQRKAKEHSTRVERKVDDILVQGQFYDALAEFLVDLPIFPFACLKGPFVRMTPTVKWVEGRAETVTEARMFWARVSPFDLFFTPGVSRIEDGAVIERVRFQRADLNALLNLKGYRSDAIRKVLIDYAHGTNDWLDPSDSTRAQAENRENPVFNRSEVLHGVEYHGSVQGRMLLQYGFSEQEVPDPDLDYAVQAWIVGRHVIKVQLSPSPRKRHPYYVTSFEKVPGTPIGNGLTDRLSDIQDVCNASLRALVNNMSISSGPQVVIDTDMLEPMTNPEQMFPWKRWYVSGDPTSNSSGRKPVEFFQPGSNAHELLGVYEKFTQIADELSAIPRYVTGSERVGGAGRTASGLAMLMGNANKVLQNVAGNIDREVMAPLLQSLFDLIMLTDQTGMLRGDEAVRVRGVTVAMQKETNRQRQLEFLTMTMNPVDLEIMGKRRRANVLRSVASEIGLDGQSVVPTDAELQRDEQQAKMTAAAMAAVAGAPGGGAAGGVEPGLAPPGAGAPPSAPAGAPGVGMPSPAKPSNQNLGVPEASAMRGMLGNAPTPGGN